jgi:hypothetical protein
MTSLGLNIGGSGIKISRVFFIGLVFNVTLDYFLIPVGLKYGAGGAGLAVCACAFASEVYTFCAMLKIFPGRLLDWRIFRNLLFTLLPAFSGVFFFEFLTQLAFFEKIVLVLLLPLYAFFTGLLSKNDLRMISSLIRSELKSRTNR